MAKILIIDDEESIRFTLKEFYSEEGYEVTTAEDYDGAMNIIDVYDFDLILADINLKGKSGIDILEKVKKKKLGLSGSYDYGST